MLPRTSAPPGATPRKSCSSTHCLRNSTQLRAGAILRATPRALTHDAPIPPSANPDEHCLQSRNAATATYDATCRFSNSTLTPLGLDAPFATCVYQSPKIPCQYVALDPTTASTLGDAPTGASTVVLEIDLGAFTTPSSTHELGLAPDGTIYATQQASDVVTSITLDRASPTADGAFSLRSIPLVVNTNGTWTPADGRLGVHALLWPRDPSALPPNAAYATLEAANAVGIVDLSTGRVLRSVAVPLACAAAAQPPLATAEGTCRGGAKPADGWRCYSCADASTTSNCSAGARPHTLAEDSAGNIWVTLKTGALARLRPLTANGPPEWWIQGLGVGSRPFYVATDADGASVWVNSVTSVNLFHVGDPTADSPTVVRVPLEHERGFGFGPPVSLSDLLHCPPDGDDDGPRPASFVVLPHGAGVVAALYQKVGVLVSAHAPGTADGCAAQPDPYASAALVGVAAGCWAAHALVPPGPREWSSGSNAAILHLATRPLRDGSTVVPTLWLAASSNDFAGGGGHAAAAGVRPPPLQPDVLLRAADVDLAHLGDAVAWRQTLLAPSQGSWIHRVLYVDEGVALATELRSDRVLVVVDEGAFAFARGVR